MIIEVAATKPPMVSSDCGARLSEETNTSTTPAENLSECSSHCAPTVLPALATTDSAYAGRTAMTTPATISQSAINDVRAMRTVMPTSYNIGIPYSICTASVTLAAIIS